MRFNNFPQLVEPLAAAIALGVQIDSTAIAVKIPQIWDLHEAIGRSSLREDSSLPGVGSVTRLRNPVNTHIGPNSWSLARWLVERGRAIGVESALAELSIYAVDSAHEFLVVMAVQGPRVEQRLQLNSELEIVPWSEGVSLAPQLTPRLEHVDESPSAAIVLRQRWASGQTELGDPHPFNVLKRAQWALFAASGIGVISGSATFCLPPNVPTRDSTVVPFGTLKRWHANGIISPEDVRLAGTLHSRLLSADASLLETVQIVADRASFGLGANNLVDRYVDLGIAGEVLFLHGNNSELTFRLALYAARFAGRDAVDRKKIFGDFSALYKLRSKAVHTGRVGKLSKEDSALSQRVARTIARGLRRAIEEGFPSSWTDLVLE